MLNWSVPRDHRRLSQSRLSTNLGEDIRAVTGVWIYGSRTTTDQRLRPVLSGQRNASRQDKRACAVESSESVDKLYNFYSESVWNENRIQGLTSF